MGKKGFVGVDLGSVSTNLIWLSEEGVPELRIYLRTHGQPIRALQRALQILKEKLENPEVLALGTTGSGRILAGKVLGADAVTNEITCHGLAAAYFHPEVQTVLEIGGQDSKIIFLKEGLVWDFAMNSVCAAGTGSFLEQQASRLEMSIEEFGQLALKSKEDLRIAGRCAVFAESDMVHKQQLGYPLEEILAGLCRALVRNYLNNLANGKKIKGPILFQGGVAANPGMHKAFEEALGQKVIIPEYYDVMGAIGASLLAKEKVAKKTAFRGFSLGEKNYHVRSRICDNCPNSCEILIIYENGQALAQWGAQCPQGEQLLVDKEPFKKEKTKTIKRKKESLLLR